MPIESVFFKLVTNTCQYISDGVISVFILIKLEKKYVHVLLKIVVDFLQIFLPNVICSIRQK